MGSYAELPFGGAVPFETDAEPTCRNFIGSARSLFNPESSIVKGRLVIADLPLNRVEAVKVLPPGLRLTEEPRARLFVASYEKSAYADPYNEAAITIFVRTIFGEGGHVGWIVVDDDTALIIGRELLGCPKKMADITYSDDGERVTAGVSRRGVDLFSIEATRREEESSPEFVFDSKAFNAGGPGQCVFLNPLWCFRLREVIYESWAAVGTVTFADSSRDPVARWFAPGSGTVPLRIATIAVTALRYMLPVGIAGPRWSLRMYNTRFR